MSKLVSWSEVRHWISSKIHTKHFTVSSIFLMFLLGGSGWKLWKYFTSPKNYNSGRDKKNKLNEISTNSELLEHLSTTMPMEFNACMKYIFENTDRKKYATDLKLSEEDFQLLKPYADSAMPIRCNATISAPHMHLTCLNALEGSTCLEDSKVDEVITCLDIGSGSGFISSALCHLLEFHGKSGKVLAIDHIDDLVELGRGNIENDENSKKFLEKNSSIQLVFHLGNGYDGKSIQKLYFESFPNDLSNNRLIENVPLFDLIHVGAASPTIPQHLYDLLKPNGRLVCPVGLSGSVQELFCIEKKVKPTLNESREMQLVQSLAKVRFVPLFGSAEDQERHYNRSNPRIVNVDEDQQIVVLPYLHLVDSSITSLEDIKWEGE